MNDENKLGQAKKRDKKIKITEIAIEKVPYIEYKGLTEEQNKIMRQLAKEVLRLSRRENDSNEVAITWDITSNNPDMYGVAYGSEHTVDVSADTLSYHLLQSAKEVLVVILYNHPSTRTFSVEDILFFLRFSRLSYLVVITNQGTIHYIKKEEYGASIVFLHRCQEVGLFYE